jgi:hypothetical protein
MRLFELIINDEEIDEVFATSLVFNPAIEALGTYFNKDEVHFAEMKEEGLFMAPILIPNKKILRVDGAGVPYEVFFSKETVKKLAQKYLEKKYTDSVTIEHEDKVEGVTLVESWIKESYESDKSKLYGLNVPVNSWIGTFKIENEEIREKFRSGELRAISIEGMFEHLERTPQDQLLSAQLWESFADFMEKDTEEFSEVEATEFLSKVKALIKKDGRVKGGKRIEMESYTDYPDSVSNNAKRGIELNEKQDNKCATQTGKVRAQQLANKEPISVETIKRMHSYLSRAEEYYDPNKSTECGTISYLLWGGKSAHGWSRNKLRELGLLQENAVQPSVNSTYPGEEVSGSIIAPELLQEEEIEVYGYETTHFFICPGAIGTFKHLTEEMDIQDDDLKDMIRAAAVIADTVFMIEDRVIRGGRAEERDLRRAKILVDMMKDVFETVNERTGMEHDISYMDGHIEVIESFL